jgi:hypothetical protein
MWRSAVTLFKANVSFSRTQDELEREDGNWVKYLGMQQQRWSALDIIKDPVANSLKLEQLHRRRNQQKPTEQQPNEAADATLIRYITACDAIQAAPQVSFLPGFQQQVLETGQTAEDGFQVARPGLRDRGLQVHAALLHHVLL